mgnify:CR=1 FL=1
MNKLMARIVAGVSLSTVAAMAAAHVPVANALPETFASPPMSAGDWLTSDSRDAWLGCTRLSGSARDYANTRSQSYPRYGIEHDAKRFDDRTEFYVNVELTDPADRVPVSLDFDIEIKNQDSRAMPYSIEAVPVDGGGADVVAPASSGGIVQPGETVTVTAPIGTSALPKYRYAQDAGPEESHRWEYKITVPHDKGSNAAFLPKIHGYRKLNVLPWPMESEDCRPLIPLYLEDLSLPADGQAHKTGMLIAGVHQDEASKKRIDGELTYNGKPVPGATVSIRGKGEVWASIPEGALGEEASADPQRVKVRFFAKPRPDTAGLGIQEYSERTVLRGTRTLTEDPYWWWRNFYYRGSGKSRITQDHKVFERELDVTIPERHTKPDEPEKTSSEKLSSESSPLWWLALIPVFGVIGLIVDQWVKLQQGKFGLSSKMCV